MWIEGCIYIAWGPSGEEQTRPHFWCCGFAVNTTIVILAILTIVHIERAYVDFDRALYDFENLKEFESR